jgi:hypothetical protein
MNEQQLREKLSAIDKEIDSFKGQHKKYLQQLADKACPYKVGENIIIKGYAHEGKQGEVITINGTTDWNGSYQWHVVVVVLKKDGTPGLQHADWQQRKD